jgi:hypothetical protein
MTSSHSRPYRSSATESVPGNRLVFEALRRDNIIVIEGFLDRNAANISIKDIIFESGKRVTATKNLTESWIECPIEIGGNLWNYLSCSNIEAIICTHIREPIKERKSWANLYSTGELIGWHCDGQGRMQLVVCLQKTEHGGIFLARIDGLIQEIELDVGDAILFDATKVPHSITALADQDGQRITAVMRFY